MAAGNVSIANITNDLKITYAKRLEVLAYTKRPFLGMIPKVTEFNGRSYNQAIRNAAMQGRSAAFATAQANRGANVYNEFTVPRTKNYAIFRIDGEVLAAGKGDGAYADALADSIEGAIEVISNDMSTNLYRSESGTRGVRGSLTAPTVLQLDTVEDVVNFEVFMEVGASATNGGGAARVGTATITAIDRDAGTLTTDGAGWAAQIAAFADGDFLFTAGDYDAKMQGMDSWVPQDRTGLAVAFNGVTRSTDPTCLAGMTFDGLGGAIETTLNNAVGRAARLGCGTLDVGLFNPVDMQDLVNALTNRIREPRTTTKKASMVGKAEIGYEGILVTTPMGTTIECFADPFAPKGIVRLLTLDSWMLKTAGKAPDFLMFDDNKILRTGDEDSYEGRMGYYGNVVCKRPGDNMVVTL